MFIDTHSHLWWDSYSDDLDRVIARAHTAGVTHFIAPGTDLHTSHQAVELAQKYPGIVFAAVGIHPEETIRRDASPTRDATVFNSTLRKLRELITTHKESIVAVGEIGTDGNTQELREQMSDQMNLFREQCEIALEFDLPVIVHTRTSLAETLTVLDSLPQMPRGQFHCFSYDERELAEVLRRGFSVSFCGNISWSKRLQRISPRVPLDRLLLETDSPLMIPRDKKGEPFMVDGGVAARNEPINVIILAQIQAELRGLTLDHIGQATSDNARLLYGLSL